VSGPLAGVKILDCTSVVLGPYAAQQLGDLGADVIKVEPPEGDTTRQLGPRRHDGMAAFFLGCNRNKRSIVLDLKSERGLADAKALAMQSDVVVENFKPGAMTRLGLDAGSLRAMKPVLIYASISGFGQNQPTLAGYDQIAQGTSGMMSITGEPGAGPAKVGVPIGDISAGMFAAHAILASLFDRTRTGEGRYIDVALNDSLLALMTYQAGRLFATGVAPRAEGNHHGTIAPYGTFAVRDGFVNIAVATDAQFARFCEALDAPELARDPRFATNADRQAAGEELTREIERKLQRRSRDEWLGVLERAGIPAGPILDLGEAFASPVAEGRGMRRRISHPVAGRITQVGPSWTLDGEPVPIRRPPPTLGEHTDEVLREWLGDARD
jgi:crotonobetainyl-CoA:carnitine CoA-transferase CaiB-like acyl-CoA transferase